LSAPARRRGAARGRAGVTRRAAGQGASGTPPPGRGRVARLLRRPPVWAVVLVLVLVHLLLAWAVFDPTVFTGGDNAAYLSLARSLIQRHAYLSLWEPLAPAHTQYPPVFPGMIALGLFLGLKSWAGIKLIVVLCSTAAVTLTYLWLRRRRRPVLALGVSALVALSPGVLALSHQELSDVPFWALAMLALWAFERLGRRERLRLALGVAAVVLAYFTRSAGLPLVLAALAWLAWRRRWRQLAILAAVIVPLAFLWWLRGKLTGGNVYAQLFWYVDPYRPASGTIGLGQLFHRIFANERAYLGSALPVLLAEQVQPLLVFISYVVALLAIFGWVVRLRRPQLAEFFFPLYIGLLFVWPEVWAGERFLLPAYPACCVASSGGSSRRSAWPRPSCSRSSPSRPSARTQRRGACAGRSSSRATAWPAWTRPGRTSSRSPPGPATRCRAARPCSAASRASSTSTAGAPGWTSPGRGTRRRSSRKPRPTTSATCWWTGWAG
jgi:hypothetical protein